MDIFFGGSSIQAGGGKIGMIFQEGDLQAVPVVFVFEHVEEFKFLEKGIADGIEIIAAEVIEVGIAEDSFEGSLGVLRNSGGHDHTADAIDIVGGITESGQMFAGDGAAVGFVILAAEDKAGVVEEGGCF